MSHLPRMEHSFWIDVTLAMSELLLGEHRRTLDERYRVAIPKPLCQNLAAPGENLILAKERTGTLSLWNGAQWQSRLDQGLALVREKLQAGRMAGQLPEVQRLGRLLSTRHTTVQMAQRGRLLIPEGFRQFLGVEPGEHVLLLGAALCVEIWRPDAWIEYLQDNVAEFHELFDTLSS